MIIAILQEICSLVRKLSKPDFIKMCEEEDID